jgi:hypothetical protein
MFLLCLAQAFVELLDRRMNVKHSTTYAKQTAPEMVQNLVVMCSNLPLLEKGLRK